MPARKTIKKKTPTAVVHKMLSENKVLRVLNTMEVDVEAFKEAYEGDTTRAGGLRPPTPEQIAAVEQFQKTGDLQALKLALETASSQSAFGAVARVVAFKAKN